MSNLLNANKVVSPSASEVEVAKEAIRVLAPRVTGNSPLRLNVKDGSPNELALPPSVARLLLDVLAEVAKGKAVVVTPLPAELPMNKAADLLNVSPLYFTKLLDEGAIPFHSVGEFRRVLLRDVMEYKRVEDEKRLEVLAELSALDQELGLY